MKRNGIERNAITYNTAISACEKGGQTDQALRLLDKMSSEGIEKNAITYSAAISACEKGGQTDKTLHLLQRATSDGIFRSDPIRQGLLDLHSKAVFTEDAYACFLTSRPEALAHDPGVPIPVARLCSSGTLPCSLLESSLSVVMVMILFVITSWIPVRSWNQGSA